MTDWMASKLEWLLDFSNILNASIAASWLILAVVVLRFLLKRAPKWTHVALWGLVAVRLLLPFSIESAFSLIPSTETVPREILRYEGQRLQEQAYLDVVTNPAISDGVAVEIGQTVDRVQVQLVNLSFIWLTGIAVLLLYAAVSYLLLRRRVAAAIRLRDNIFQGESVDSPFVLGLVRPKIFLPGRMDEEESKHVIAHEQAHIKRRDHWWKPLGFLLLTIHWFNPLMWLAYILLCRDIELACDEKVIRDLGNEQRADYTQALLACSVNRRLISACPLAFGEVGVKERVKSVMNYKKPAFWIVLLAVVACMVVAVCFLTDPETKQDLSFLNYENLVAVAAQADTHPAARSDDQHRYIIDGPQLAQFLDTANWTAQTGITRNVQRDTDQNSRASIQIALDGIYLKVFDTDTANIYDGTTGKDRYYRMGNGDYGKLLAMLSLDSEHTADVTKWFDYLEAPNEMQWDGSLEINLPEFPDVTFRWTYAEIVAVKGNEITSLYTGMPIWNAYFCDLTDDGLPELCSTISWGSGMIDNRVIIYDYANGVSYSMEDRGVSDYTLRQNESDGQLYVDKRSHIGGGFLSTGRLVFEDDCLQVLWPEKPNDNIREITDPTDDPNFAYDTAVEKIFEDENNEYFIGGLYSRHIIVHYTDGTQEDIVTALNAGRATIADLNRFDIPFWAEPKNGGKTDGEMDAAAGFYLTVGAEGVTYIEISTANGGGGCQNADGSPFKKGEQIWLEPLSGAADLRGVEITAMNQDGEVVWSASVPDGDENRGFTHLTQDGWTITDLPSSSG